MFKMRTVFTSMQG